MRSLLFYLLGTLAFLICLYFFYSPVYKADLGVTRLKDTTMIQEGGKFISPRQISAVIGD